MSSPSSFIRLFAACATLALWAQPARAQQPVARPTLRLTRAAATAPTIDGQLDDPVWITAARADRFVQVLPVEGEPATEQTEILVAYDRERIYIAIHAHYSDAGLVRANRVDRDRIWSDDWVSVLFDPFLDRQRAYRFAVNGYGVQGDALVGNSGGTGDTSWDALFVSAGALRADGWTAEIAIPFKSLRYPAKGEGEVHRWGLQIQRVIVSKNESVVWSPVSRDVISELGQTGFVEGFTSLSTSRNFEILPTFTAVQVRKLNTPGGGYRTDTQPEGGLNLKYGINSNVTFDFTFNPDFSQIESDRQQIEVNQRFPVQYPELRPFFLEGQDIFRIPGPVTFIHTRTIVDPQWGTKLTGKIRKTTFSLMLANDEAPGNLEDRTDPAFGKNAQFVFARARYDLYAESTASLIFTDREFLDRYSRAYGFDTDVALGRTRRIFARFIFTDHVDAAAVRRTGHFYDINFRTQGRHLGYSVITNAISPDLRTDAGFVRRTDQRQTLGNVSYQWWPEHWLVNWGPRISYSRNYQFDGTLQDEQRGATVNFTFARNITFSAGANRDMERFSNIDFWKTRYSFGGRVASSRRIEFGTNFGRGDQIRFITTPFLGLGTTWDVSTTLRPVSRFQSDISLTSSHLTDPSTKAEVFDIKIFRSQWTYQFTPRFLVRNIMEFNTFDKTVGANLLLTYRVNSGTVFYAGYDDRFRQGDQIGSTFSTADLLRTNRAIFMKVQYLLRVAG